MGYLRDHFGGKNYFAKMDDEQLLDHLADLITEDRYSCGGGIRSMLSVIFDRVSQDREAHRVLLPVAKKMAWLEENISNYSVPNICGILESTVNERYFRNHPSINSWQSLKLQTS